MPLLLLDLPPEVLFGIVLNLPARSQIAIARLCQVCTVLRQIIADNADAVWHRQLELLFAERQKLLPAVAASSSFDSALPLANNIVLKPGAAMLSLFKAMLHPVEVWTTLPISTRARVQYTAWHKAEILAINGSNVEVMCLSRIFRPRSDVRSKKKCFSTLSSNVRSIDWHAEDQYLGNTELLHVGDAVDVQRGPRTRDMNDMSWSQTGTVQRLEWIGKSSLEDFEPQLDASHVPLLKVHVHIPENGDNDWNLDVEPMASSRIRRPGAMRHALPIT